MKALNMPLLGLGAFADMNFFYVSKKRDDFSHPEHMELCPLSYKEQEDFHFSLIPSSYLHGPSRQMAQDG